MPGTFTPPPNPKKTANLHYGTSATHVPWCMSGSLSRGGRENVPGISGAFATCNFVYLVRGQASPILRATALIIGRACQWTGLSHNEPDCPSTIPDVYAANRTSDECGLACMVRADPGFNLQIKFVDACQFVSLSKYLMERTKRIGRKKMLYPWISFLLHVVVCLKTKNKQTNKQNVF